MFRDLKPENILLSSEVCAIIHYVLGIWNYKYLRDFHMFVYFIVKP